MDAKLEKCAHPGCQCDATEENRPYCSDSCASRGSRDAQGCECGHADCEA